jgi:hypothetical protein
MPDAFPLAWPHGWPRTKDYQRRHHSQFKGNTFARARDTLATELERLGGIDPILSTNVPLRLDGQPRGDFRDGLPDPGVAVYFVLGKRSLVMARDEFAKVSDNLRSLALAIEYLRGMRRHGGATMMDRVFTGFAQLPAPGTKRSCWDVLGLHLTDVVGSFDQKVATVDGAYRSKARQHHPDVGGTDTQMAEINGARDAALREIGAAS